MSTPIIVSSLDIGSAIVVANIVKGLLWSKTDLIDISQVPAHDEEPNIYLDVNIHKFYSNLKNAPLFLLQVGRCAHRCSLFEAPMAGNLHMYPKQNKFEELYEIAVACLQTWYPNITLNHTYGKARGLGAVACVAGRDCNVFFYGVNKCWWPHAPWPPNNTDLTTLAELGAYLHVPIDEEIGGITIGALSQQSYRLGDIVKMDGEARKYLMETATLHSTIGKAYVDRSDTFNDLELLADIVREYLVKYNIQPCTNRLALHLRLTDHPYADTQLMEVGSKFHTMLHSQKWERVVITAAIHIPNAVSTEVARVNLTRDQSILLECIDMVTKLGIPYTVQSSRDPDYDFCLGCSSIVVPSVGRFSKFMHTISQQIHNGAQV